MGLLGHIDTVPVGNARRRRTACDVPEKLYGREHEVDGPCLRGLRAGRGSGYDRVRCLVSGYSGVGKSSSRKTSYTRLLCPLPRGAFRAANSTNISATLRNANPERRPSRRLLGQSSSRAKRKWTNGGAALRRTWVRSGQPDGDLIPDWSPHRNKPTFTDLLTTPRDAHNRFHWFSGGSSACSRGRGTRSPLVPSMILQWLDARRSNLIERPDHHSECRNLLCLSDHTPNKRGASSHPLMRMLVAIRKTGTKMACRNRAAALGLDDVVALVPNAF